MRVSGSLWCPATGGPLSSSSSSTACVVPVACMAMRYGTRVTPCSPLQWRTLLPAQPSAKALHSSRRNPPSRSRLAALPPLAMVNVDFASPSLVLGAALIGCGVLLLQLRSLQNQVSRDADIVVAAMVSIVGSTLIFQGWRLDPLLLLCQALTTSVAFWYGLEAFRLRTKEAQQQQQQQALPPPDATSAYYPGQQQGSQGQDAAIRGMGGMPGGFYDPQGAPQFGAYPDPLKQPGQSPTPKQWGGSNDMGPGFSDNGSGLGGAFPWLQQQQQQQRYQATPLDPSPAPTTPRWGLPAPASTSGGRPFAEAITLDYYGNPLPTAQEQEQMWEGGYVGSYDAAPAVQTAGQYEGVVGGQYTSPASAGQYEGGSYGSMYRSEQARAYQDGGAGTASTSGTSGSGSNNGGGSFASGSGRPLQPAGFAYEGVQAQPGSFDSDAMAADASVAPAANQPQLQWQGQQWEPQQQQQQGAGAYLARQGQYVASEGAGPSEQQLYWTAPPEALESGAGVAGYAGGYPATQGVAGRGGASTQPGTGAGAATGGKGAATMFEPVDDWE